MKYKNKEAQDAFSGRENYDKPLAALEQSFREAGMNIKFYCEISELEEKTVSIYQDGFLRRRLLIEGDNPAAAVKDVAERVKL